MLVAYRYVPYSYERGWEYIQYRYPVAYRYRTYVGYRYVWSVEFCLEFFAGERGLLPSPFWNDLIG